MESEAGIRQQLKINTTPAPIGETLGESVVLDEAGQALEPGAWIPVRLADRVVLAGDACQLPPTVKDPGALKAGLGVSLLEKAIARERNVHLLDTQYRMHADIMAHPNLAFYDGALQAAPGVLDRVLEGGCLR